MDNLYTNITLNINLYALKRLIATFIKRGQKAKALKLFLFALRTLKKKKNETQKISSLEFINTSLMNTIPEVFMIRLRRGSKMFTFPKIINDEKKIKISLLWIRKSVEENKNLVKLEDKFLNQIIDSFYFRGKAIEKRNKLYSVLLQNRPFLYKLKQRRKFIKKII